MSVLVLFLVFVDFGFSLGFGFGFGSDFYFDFCCFSWVFDDFDFYLVVALLPVPKVLR